MKYIMEHEILDLIDRYWMFDKAQTPVSNWYDKQDLMEAVRKALEEPLNVLSEEISDVEDVSGVMPIVIYLVTNEDKRTVESSHWKLEDAKKEVDVWSRNDPQFQFMVVELEIH